MIPDPKIALQHIISKPDIHHRVLIDYPGDRLVTPSICAADGSGYTAVQEYWDSLKNEVEDVRSKARQ